MENEFMNLIREAQIPKSLKTYLINSKEGVTYLNESMLKDIEELYIFYNSLYYFDEVGFSSYTISSLKRGLEVYNYFFYLKKIIDSNIDFINKNVEFKHIKSIIEDDNPIINNIINEFNYTVDLFYKRNYSSINLLKTINILGKMEIAVKISNNSFYEELFNKGKYIIKDELTKSGIDAKDIDQFLN